MTRRGNGRAISASMVLTVGFLLMSVTGPTVGCLAEFNTATEETAEEEGQSTASATNENAAAAAEALLNLGDQGGTDASASISQALRVDKKGRAAALSVPVKRQISVTPVSSCPSWTAPTLSGTSLSGTIAGDSGSCVWTAGQDSSDISIILDCDSFSSSAQTAGIAMTGTFGITGSVSGSGVTLETLGCSDLSMTFADGGSCDVTCNFAISGATVDGCVTVCGAGFSFSWSGFTENEETVNCPDDQGSSFYASLFSGSCTDPVPPTLFDNYSYNYTVNTLAPTLNWGESKLLCLFKAACETFVDRTAECVSAGTAVAVNTSCGLGLNVPGGPPPTCQATEIASCFDPTTQATCLNSYQAYCNTDQQTAVFCPNATQQPRDYHNCRWDGDSCRPQGSMIGNSNCTLP